MAKDEGIRMEFGQMLRSARQARGWSMSKLSWRIEVGEGTIYAWETGKNAPGFEHFLDLSILFDWPHVMLADPRQTDVA
jgi:ribosome-binding protein aMBF1 (putative translation factor)